mgnify:CR=1 FL=1
MKNIKAANTPANQPANFARRKFIVDTTVAGGGLALAFHIPFADAVDKATGGINSGDEVNAWVLIKPDETCVIRIARSEMGQGTLTGLAQLVAEELECDWKKVTTEYPTPGENLKSGRVWKNFSTGGSRGIRQSNQ